MSRTKRNASRWMEHKFKFGDTRYPEKNESHYFNRRYQEKMRNGNRSSYTIKLNPLTMKKATWDGYGSWAKAAAKRNARHQAKIIVTMLAHTQVQEDWADYWADQFNDDDWYEDDSMEFNYSWSDEAYDYAEQRRQKELEESYLDYGYDPFPDWDY